MIAGCLSVTSNQFLLLEELLCSTWSGPTHGANIIPPTDQLMYVVPRQDQAMEYILYLLWTTICLYVPLCLLVFYVVPRPDQRMEGTMATSTVSAIDGVSRSSVLISFIY